MKNISKNIIGICIFTLLMCMKNPIYAEPQDEFRLVRNDGKVIYFSNEKTKVWEGEFEGEKSWITYQIVKHGSTYELRFRTNITNNNSIFENSLSFPRMLTGWISSIGYRLEKDKQTHYFLKDGRMVLYHNAVAIEPAEMDNQVNIMKSSILSADDRRNRWELGDRYQVWTNYQSNRLSSRILNGNKNFKKESHVNMLHIGIDRVNPDTLTGIYLIRGTEKAKYFRNIIFDAYNKYNISAQGHYVSDGDYKVSGWGVHHTRYLKNGVYADIAFQRLESKGDMKTVDNGMFANEKASRSINGTGISFEVGKEIPWKNDWHIEPQLQYTMFKMHGDSYKDSLDDVYPDLNPLPKLDFTLHELRAGVKATRKNVYVKANVYLNNYDGLYAKKVMERYSSVKKKRKRGIDVVGEIELGLEKEIKKDVTINSAITYRTGKNENNMKVKLGVSAKF